MPAVHAFLEVRRVGACACTTLYLIALMDIERVNGITPIHNDGRGKYLTVTKFFSVCRVTIKIVLASRFSPNQNPRACKQGYPAFPLILVPLSLENLASGSRYGARRILRRSCANQAAFGSLGLNVGLLNAGA
jgi:hypothetical protein